MPDFNFNAGSFPIASVIDAAQRKAQLEQQAKIQNATLFDQGLTQIGQVGQSLVDKRMKVAQALALGKQFDIPDAIAKGMDPSQILQVGAIKKGNIDMNMLMTMLHPGFTPNVASGGTQTSSSVSTLPTQGNGAMLTSNTTSTPIPETDQNTTPVPIQAPPAMPRTVNKATADMAYKMALANKTEPVMTRSEAEAAGGVKHGTHILPDEKGPQDILDPKYQDKLEKQYTDLKAKFLSNRSGGAGLENIKVDQAIHLRKAINQYYNPETGSYTIPPSLHSEFVIGLARLMSPNGQVAQETMNDLRQRTAREGAANVLISIGFDPKQVGGTTQSVAKFFVEQIDRQGQTSEENRNGYMDFIKGQAPSDLDPNRIEKHDKVGLNSFSDLLNKSPDKQSRSSVDKTNWSDASEQRLQMLLEKQKNGSLKS